MKVEYLFSATNSGSEWHDIIMDEDDVDAFLNIVKDKHAKHYEICDSYTSVDRYKQVHLKYYTLDENGKRIPQGWPYWVDYTIQPLLVAGEKRFYLSEYF